MGMALPQSLFDDDVKSSNHIRLSTPRCHVSHLTPGSQYDAGAFHKLLNKDAIIAKTIHCLGFASRETLCRFFIIKGDAQTFTAATRRSLDHD